MKGGFIYILGNPMFSRNVLKIGLTRKSSSQRAKGLSRSTAIPLDFVVRREIPVEDVDIAERRIHLMLDQFRINPNKEFFKISLSKAVELCKAIAAYENEDCSIANEIFVSHKLLGARYPGIPFRCHILIYSLMGATMNNTLVDHAFRLRRGIVDGFVSAEQIAKIYRVGTRAAAGTMRTLALSGSSTACHPIDKSPIEPVFDFVRYHKGHMAWRFSIDFRANFRTSKT